MFEVNCLEYSLGKKKKSIKKETIWKGLVITTLTVATRTKGSGVKTEFKT